MAKKRAIELLEMKIEELRELNKMEEIDMSSEIGHLEEKLEALKIDTYSNLSDWERVKIARHPERPYALDYIKEIFTDFYELHGDRLIGDDRALLVGLAHLQGKPVVLLAQQKGHSTEENKERYFGMPRPQGYRKARRIMTLAERFSFPLISLIDTPGAYPGLEAEEFNIGGAIASNLLAMAELRTPTIAVIVGEGGSGGALAVGVADRVLMLENATYSVISPEGAAAILWKDKGKIRQAAQALSLTAEHLLKLGVVDEVIPEPLGGAHKNPAKTIASLNEVLVRYFTEVCDTPQEDLLSARYKRYRSYGCYRTLSDR